MSHEQDPSLAGGDSRSQRPSKVETSKNIISDQGILVAAMNDESMTYYSNKPRLTIGMVGTLHVHNSQPVEPEKIASNSWCA